MSDRSPTSGKTKAALLMAGLFLAGLALGVALDRFVIEELVCEQTMARETRRRRRRHRHKRLDRLVSRFTRKLGLNEKQKKVVKEALQASWEDTKKIKRKVEPKLREVREAHREKIRQVLEPDQLERYNRMVRRYEERRARRLH
jgi:hypothetical protein